MTQDEQDMTSADIRKMLKHEIGTCGDLASHDTSQTPQPSVHSKHEGPKNAGFSEQILVLSGFLIAQGSKVANIKGHP